MQQLAGPEPSISGVKLEPSDQVTDIHLKPDLGVPENQRSPMSGSLFPFPPVMLLPNVPHDFGRYLFAFTDGVIVPATNIYGLIQSLIGNVNQCNGSMSDLHIQSIICRLGQSVLHLGNVTRGKMA